MGNANPEVEEIIRGMERNGHASEAGRVRELCRLIDDDDEEPDIDVESLRGLAGLLDKYDVRRPAIGVTPNGHMQAYWREDDRFSLAMNFLPNKGYIQFSMLHYDSSGLDRQLSGKLPPEEVMGYVGKFVLKDSVPGGDAASAPPSGSQSEMCWINACSLEDGHYDMHGMCGIDGKICIDCFLTFLAEGKLAVVDPDKKTGLRCYGCKKEFTLRDTVMQNRTSGAARCPACSFKSESRRRS